MPTQREDLKRTFSDNVAAYDRLRPNYPTSLPARVLRGLSTPCRMLEVGCGTGIATPLFLPQASEFLGLDPSAPMIAFVAQQFANEPKARFLRASFEEAELQPEHYDLLISAQAFHWLDLNVAFPKVKRVLRRGGRLALFWNYFDFEASAECVEIRDCILDVAPTFGEWPDASRFRYAQYKEQWLETLRETGIFEPPWSRTLLRKVQRDGAWLTGWLATLSWYRVLDVAVQSELSAQLRARIRDGLTLKVKTLLIVADVVA